eukprot:scaffold30429_cov45-Phaeocystis_antarctica.AAC.1
MRGEEGAGAAGPSKKDNHKDTNIYILRSKEFTKLCVAVQSHPKTKILYHCAAAEPVGDTQWPGARASSLAQLPSARSTLSQGAKGAFRLISETVHLDGQRQGNRRLGRRLARAPEAVAGRPEGRPLPGSAELPKAARCALRRRRSRAGALPRLPFDPAGALAELLGARRRRRALLRAPLGRGGEAGGAGDGPLGQLLGLLGHLDRRQVGQDV